MTVKDYRILKAKGVADVFIDGTTPTYSRPLYNSITGEVSQTRSDSIYTSDIEARRAELVEEIKDIDALLSDISTALSEKAADLGEEKTVP